MKILWIWRKHFPLIDLVSLMESTLCSSRHTFLAVKFWVSQKYNEILNTWKYFLRACFLPRSKKILSVMKKYYNNHYRLVLCEADWVIIITRRGVAGMNSYRISLQPPIISWCPKSKLLPSQTKQNLGKSGQCGWGRTFCARNIRVGVLTITCSHSSLIMVTSFINSYYWDIPSYQDEYKSC